MKNKDKNCCKNVSVFFCIKMHKLDFLENLVRLQLNKITLFPVRTLHMLILLFFTLLPLDANSGKKKSRYALFFADNWKSPCVKKHTERKLHEMKN